ncbi:GrdX family protein [Clostridium polynesiense]|uniref:GrdX family protein n=1 Tax=Clostridium polynesiense TaxID=1325933 RepID=UPI000591349E|nr:GrdX family protein [Clostridium polynesiense]
MIEKFFIITNNPLCRDSFKDSYKVNYLEGTVSEVFSAARDYIHKGHILLTHPLLSSIKPNETPYRSILISQASKPGVDMNSLEIMESSIHTLEKFLRDFKTPKWNERILEDFQFIDYDLTLNAIR